MTRRFKVIRNHSTEVTLTTADLEEALRYGDDPEAAAIEIACGLPQSAWDCDDIEVIEL